MEETANKQLRNQLQAQQTPPPPPRSPPLHTSALTALAKQLQDMQAAQAQGMREMRTELQGVKQELEDAVANGSVAAPSSKQARSRVTEWMGTQAHLPKARPSYTQQPQPAYPPPPPLSLRADTHASVAPIRDNKRVKLPEFDGSGNINGFLARFKWQVERVHSGGEVGDDDRKGYLVS